jgi:hypothetical protein
MKFEWKDELANDGWETLSALYTIAPLGEKKAGDLEVFFRKQRLIFWIITCLQQPKGARHGIQRDRTGAPKHKVV